MTSALIRLFIRLAFEIGMLVFRLAFGVGMLLGQLLLRLVQFASRRANRSRPESMQDSSRHESAPRDALIVPVSRPPAARKLHPRPRSRR